MATYANIDAPDNTHLTSRNTEHTSAASHFKAKARKLLHIGHEHTPSVGPTQDTLLLAPAPSEDYEDDRLTDVIKGSDQNPLTLKKALQEPIETIKSLGTGSGGSQLAEHGSKQEIPHGADVKLVKVTDGLNDASTPEKKKVIQENLDTIQQERQDSFVRWTIDRHVHRVQKIPPNVELKNSEAYVTVDQHGKKQTDWLQFGQDVCIVWFQY
jgi:hypothetical protein